MSKYALILCFLLTSCTRTIYIAGKCPTPVIPPEPMYATESLQSNDSYGTIVKAYVNDLRQCKKELKVCRMRLGAYRHEPI